MTGKLTKTEKKLLDRIDSRAAGCTSVEGRREHNAAMKLIEKGLVKIVARHKGVTYSRHGQGRYAYSRPRYTTEITIARA